MKHQPLNNMTDTPTIEVKPQWEYYPKNIDQNSNYPLYRIEFHSWDGSEWTWKLTKRNFIHSQKEHDKRIKSENNEFTKFFMSREGHPYTLIEDVVLHNECIPNKEWLYWMCDALNEKTLKEYHIKNNRARANLDPYTYGNTPAAVNLVKILNETNNQIYSKRVTRILNKVFFAFKQLANITSDEIRKNSYHLTRDQVINTVNKSTLPDVIKTHINNIIVYKYRMYTT